MFQILKNSELYYFTDLKTVLDSNMVDNFWVYLCTHKIIKTRKRRKGYLLLIPTRRTESDTYTHHTLLNAFDPTQPSPCWLYCDNNNSIDIICKRI